MVRAGSGFLSVHSSAATHFAAALDQVQFHVHVRCKLKAVMSVLPGDSIVVVLIAGGFSALSMLWQSE